MNERCKVCDKETNNLRKHCVGKFLNNPEDIDHLIGALELTPSSLSYLKNHYLQEVKHGREEGSGSVYDEELNELRKKFGLKQVVKGRIVEDEKDA